MYRNLIKFFQNPVENFHNKPVLFTSLDVSGIFDSYRAQKRGKALPEKSKDLVVNDCYWVKSV